MNEKLIAFERLLTIMSELREKCPWDKKQTFLSLRQLTIEETYELADALLDNDLEEIKNELGDLIMHISFYSLIAEEQKAFDISDVINSVCDKLVERHPHIYGDTSVSNAEDVKENWEKIKLKSGRKSVLEGVPKSLPALIKATRIQDKVKGVGFDWENKEQVIEKMQEEWQELEDEISKDSEKIEDEFGDVLFSLINYARFIDVNPENALEKTNKKFIRRFQQMEEMIREDKKDITNMNLNELDTYWEKAKQLLA